MPAEHLTKQDRCHNHLDRVTKVKLEAGEADGNRSSRAELKGFDTQEERIMGTGSKGLDSGTRGRRALGMTWTWTF